MFYHFYYVTIYTVFPLSDDLPQDFDDFYDALTYGIENFGDGYFLISSPI